MDFQSKLVTLVLALVVLFAVNEAYAGEPVQSNQNITVLIVIIRFMVNRDPHGNGTQITTSRSVIQQMRITMKKVLISFMHRILISNG